MTDKSTQAAETYNSISKEYAETFSEPSDHIDEFLAAVSKGRKILDAGCGPGVDSKYMVEKGFEVIGLDLSSQMIQLARKKSPGTKFLLADLREIDFEDGSFDGLLASYSLIHVPKKDAPRTLSAFFEVLKPGGVACIGIQEGTSSEVFLPEPLKPDQKMFLNVMSAEELKELMQTAGFENAFEFVRKAELAEPGEFELNKYVLICRKPAD